LNIVIRINLNNIIIRIFIYLIRRFDGRRLKLVESTTLAGISRSIMGAGKTMGRLLTPNGALMACTPPFATLLGKSGTIDVLIGCIAPRGRLRLAPGDDGNGRLRPRLNIDGGGGGGLRRLLGFIGPFKIGGVSITLSSGGASPNN
jgi:hypothetical protein